MPASGSTGNGFAETRVPAATTATVSGRVYEEKSNPANTTDDGNSVDPGVPNVTVALACTGPGSGPAFNASVTTGADGSYSFANVPTGASCTITQTQPSGYTSAYNAPGAGNTGNTGGTGNGNSTISLTVPASGSTGNGFAETRTLPTPAPAPGPAPLPSGLIGPVAVPTLEWPALAFMSALLAGIGGWRRQRRNAA